MAWTKKLTQLNDVLSDLVPNKDGITKHVKAAGLKPQHINESGNAMDVKLSNNLLPLFCLFCIKNHSKNLCNSLVFCTFKYEIHQRNQQKPTPAICLID